MGLTVVGLCGRARSGKDSAADAMQSIFSDSSNVIRLSFAKALKLEVAAACGVTAEFIEDHKELFRPMLQWWGTDFRRRLFGQDYWVRKVADELKERFHDDVELILVTDARFPNEVEFVRRLGGYMVLVIRPGQKLVNAHSSEDALSGIIPDATLPNTSTLWEFQSEAIKLLCYLMRIRDVSDSSQEAVEAAVSEAGSAPRLRVVPRS